MHIIGHAINLASSSYPHTPFKTAMMIGKRRERNESVLVVLEGNKLSSNEKNGVAPLEKALREFDGKVDELLVLAVLNSNTSTYTNTTSAGTSRSCEAGETCIDLLHQEISRRKEAYKKILRPFYRICNKEGVKFELKIAIDRHPKDLIVEEATNMKATRIFMDSCFARDLSFRLNGTDYIVSLVSDDEASLGQPNDESGSSADEGVNSKPKESDLHHPLLVVKDSIQLPPPSLVTGSRKETESTSKQYDENEVIIEVEEKPTTRAITAESTTSKKPSATRVLIDLPQQLSREVIAEITEGFKKSYEPNENFTTYYGYLPGYNSYVLVKQFKGDCNGILKAEKRAAMTMCHRNIQGLIGYHQRKDATFLVFRNTKRGTLGNYLFGNRGKQIELAFQDKMTIALGTAQGIQYMHEACPQGPVVHGRLLPRNILLGYDFQPLISGFEKATWLHLEQESQISKNRPKDPSDQKSQAQVKTDILAFGVLLMRLFCQRSIPQNDKLLIDWARPLILDRAFHTLLGEYADNSDLHGIYRVMSAALQCTRTKPVTRPCISEVIALLKGEIFCCMQSSPSNNSE